VPEWILQLLGIAGTLAVGYATIRSDLAKLHERTTHTAHTADRAHERIDALIQQKGNLR